MFVMNWAWKEPVCNIKPLGHSKRLHSIIELWFWQERERIRIWIVRIYRCIIECLPKIPEVSLYLHIRTHTSIEHSIENLKLVPIIQTLASLKKYSPIRIIKNYIYIHENNLLKIFGNSFLENAVMFLSAGETFVSNNIIASVYSHHLLY